MTILFRISIVLTTALCALATKTWAAGVIIDEIMYHPASENMSESYVELYNSGTVATNISGWRFTRGLAYTFPTNTVLGAGAYLVVAADAAVFTAKYPGIANFVAGWPAPMTSHLRLENAQGQLVNEVNFSNDGDWASRVLTNTGFATFGHWGWLWYAPHDGLGSSLELMNPNLPNSFAHNWNSSSTPNGTPGKPNSVASANVAPFVTRVAHSPAIPHATDVVTVTARITDEHTTGIAATVYYRNASSSTPPAFTSVPMSDDGGHGDGLPADGIFGAILPAQPVGTVVEFYIQAVDAENNIRRYPAVIPPSTSPRTANLLYQVDNGTYTGSQPIYRIIMTEMERAELYQIGRGCPDMDSDAQMNATWVSIDGISGGGDPTQVRYNIGVRNRGHGTRNSNPNNYHVNIPGDRAWRGVTGLNLNSQYAYSQVLGSAIFRSAAVPMAESRPVQVRVNSTNLMTQVGNNSFGSYAANEQYNNDFVQRAFALDPYGNSYRAIRDQTLCDTANNSVADLTWHGANYAQAVYTNAYFKQNNFLQNDWSDVIDLIAVLNSQDGYQAANYVDDVQRRLNVDEWMQYMALNTLLDNDETCLANGTGDDYALFRGTNDTRFLALSYDMDTVMGRGLTGISPRHSIWRMTALPVMDRFMKTPEFAPVYYRWLKTFAETVFAPGKMNPMLDQLLTGYVPQANIDNFKAFNGYQTSFVLSQIPLGITITHSLGTGTPPRTTSPAVALAGTANAIQTRTVLVNGTPASWVAWSATWSAPNVPLYPGVNRVLVQSLDSNGVEFDRAYQDIWYDDLTVATVGGTIAADTTWTAAGGPYSITSTLTIASGATLTIQPGTTVYLGAGVNFVVANGGRLLAEGASSAPVRFTVAPGSGVSWGGMTIGGAVGSPETRIAYACFEGNGNTCIEVAGGTLYLDHSTFLTTTHQYVSLDGASFVIAGCYFPTSTAAFELLHGTGGIKTGGRGIVRDCFFGTTTGYNDIMDFTGGNRDLGQPIIQYLNNVFSGASDDILDLDGTDAWIEGNIFLHSHRNGSPDSSSAVSGGNYNFGGSDGIRTSEITVVGNLFFDCDNAATVKEGNFFTLINNTIVHITKSGGEDFDSGVVNVRDTTPDITPFGLGYYLEGNIIWDAGQLVRNYDPAQTTVTFNNNLLPMPWAGPGTNNLVASPLLKYIPQVSETRFTNWQSAQVLRDWFSLLPGSPAHGTGPNGQDKGGVVPIGASVAGPVGTNNQTSAALTVGVVRSGFAIPTAGWPNGSGYTHYKYSLDGGPWSAETPTPTPILLSGLANGQHRVDVVGKRDSGYYQNAAEFGDDAVVTSSRTWTVDTAYVPPSTPTLRINEILAQNSTTLTNAGTTPDLVELYNYGNVAVPLVGMGLTDNTNQPYKFTFPAGTPPLEPGHYLVLYADSATAASGTHLGFSLKASGDDLYLRGPIASGGALIDWVTFGIQLPDFSIGRGPDGVWTLCEPTFGTNNLAVPLADVHQLRINEWLADSLFLSQNDFIELYNHGSLPAALGGCYLSDAEGAPALNPIPALSYIAPTGYTAFVADGDPGQGADHLNFKLDPNVGIIMLSDPDLAVIDVVAYGPQRTDVAQGRSPSGGDTVADFSLPTPGGPNPAPNGGDSTVTNITAQVVALLDINQPWKYENSGGTNLGTAWLQVGYNDAAWPSGLGLFGYETTPLEYPYAFRTTIPAPNQVGGKIAVYYRTHFQWDGSLTNYTLVSTNYVDDGAVYYLNGVRIGSIRMPESVTYNTVATGQIAAEGAPEFLWFTNQPVVGDNVMAVEVHQVGTTSSDDVFGMQLNAVQFTTNIIFKSAIGVPVVLNEILASNRSLTNADGTLSDWVELYNPSTNGVDISDISLSDDPNAPRKFVFAQGTVIPKESTLLLYCNNDLPPAANNTGFSLKATADVLYLFNSLANGGGLLDAVSFGLQTPDFSIGRIPNGSGTWTLNVPTPGLPNNAAGLGTPADLVVNEWMADPLSGNDWFELYNQGLQPVALAGLSFTDDLTKPALSPVPPLSFIGSGANGFIKFVADGDPAAGSDHANFRLSRLGETIGLYSPAGTLVTAVTFGVQTPGVSEGRFPDGSSTITNFPSTSSPAESNFLPLTDVFVNEVLSHTDPPYEDAVEFYNAGANPVEMTGWFLSNSADDLKKYRLPNTTTIQGHSFAVFYEYQFNPLNSSSVPFEFNSAHGDRVYLSQADAVGNLTGYRAVATFGAARNGVSFARYTNSIGQVDYVAATAPTFGVSNPASVELFRTGTGAPNAAPKVGPVVINEVMFYPPMLGGLEDNTQDEFIELLNVTSSAVNLFDPAAPTNTWKLKGGVDFSLPQNVVLPAGTFLLVVNFNPAADPVALAEFRARYSLADGVPLFGPYAGNLANGGETVTLLMPDPPQTFPAPDAGFVPYVVVDRISYLEGPPWPAGAAGTGSSFQRQNASQYGNDPANWFVAAPTPGRANTADPLDVNGDGLPDAWQIRYFGSFAAPNAAPGADPDQDGFNNAQEYAAGTDPSNPASYLKVDAVTVLAGGASIKFAAVAGHSYSILQTANPATGPWTKLADIPVQSVTGPVVVDDPQGGETARFYRLVTPQLP